MHSPTESTAIDELINYPHRIIVAGTRDYNDYLSFSKVISDIISKYPKNEIAFISGKAKTGADDLIIRWCKAHDYPCFEFPADWDKYKKQAGYIRNIEMSLYANVLIVFWDNVSPGTRHMIDIAKKKKIPVEIHLVSIEDSHDKGMICFYGKDHPLSHHHIRAFIVNNVTFNCVEQFMMYYKARLFGDLEIANQILETDDPVIQKRLGRQVKNFNQAIWNEHREKCIFVGNLHKFTQNASLSSYLLDTGDKELVEASPIDTTYGVGLSENDPRIKSKNMWRGMNLCGIAIMKVRKIIREKE